MLQEFERNEKNDVPTIISSDDYADIAEYYYNNDDAERAEHVVDVALGLYPGAISPLLMKARIELIDRNNPDLAEQIAEQIEDKTDPDYHYFVAELMLSKGQASDADEYLEEHFNDYDEEERDYFAIDSATLFLDYDNVEFATKWLRRTTDTSFDEYTELIARLAAIHGEFDKAIRAYKKLLDNNPYSIDYWTSLATAQFMNNDMEDTVNSCEYILAIDPKNATGLVNKAGALYNIGNYEEAINCYKHYLELYPNDEDASLLIGQCCILLDNYEEAINYLQKAKSLAEPDSLNLPNILRSLAGALSQSGQAEKGLAELDSLVGAEKETWETKFYRGELLQCLGREDEADECFTQAIEDSDCDPEIVTTIAGMFYENENIQSAYKIFSSFFKRVKDYHHGHACFASCCYDLGLETEFLEQLQLAVKYEPDVASKALSHIFPAGMSPSKYYQYYVSHNQQ